MNDCWKELANNATDRKIVFSTSKSSYQEDAQKCLCVWSEKAPSSTREAKHLKVFRQPEQQRSVSSHLLEPSRTNSSLAAWSDAPTAMEKAMEKKIHVPVRNVPSTHTMEQVSHDRKKQARGNPNIRARGNPAYAGLGESPQEADTAEAHMGEMPPQRGSHPCQSNIPEEHKSQTWRNVAPRDHASSDATRHPFGLLKTGWTGTNKDPSLGRPALRERHNSNDSTGKIRRSKHVHFPEEIADSSGIDQRKAKFLRTHSMPSSADLAEAAESRRHSSIVGGHPMQHGTCSM